MIVDELRGFAPIKEYWSDGRNCYLLIVTCYSNN